MIEVLIIINSKYNINDINNYNVNNYVSLSHVSHMLYNLETVCICFPLFLLQLLFSLVIFSHILDRRCRHMISVVIRLWLRTGVADFSFSLSLSLSPPQTNYSLLFSCLRG